MRKRVWGFMSGAAGFILCTSAAGVLTAVFRGRGGAEAAPWLLLLIVPFVARYLGSPGAMLGVVAAALIFSAFLFQPIGNPSVEGKSPKESLLLMLSLGVPTAYFVGRSSDSDEDRHTSEQN